MNICANIQNKILANNIQQQSMTNKQDKVNVIQYNYDKEKKVISPDGEWKNSNKILLPHLIKLLLNRQEGLSLQYLVLFFHLENVNINQDHFRRAFLTSVLKMHITL